MDSIAVPSADRASAAFKKNLAVSVFKQGLSEAFGALLFSFIGCVVYVTTGKIDVEAVSCMRIIVISLSDGLSFYALVYLTMRLSDEKGSYFNPATTISLFVLDSYMDRQYLLHFMRAFFFIICQLFGAVFGTLLALLLTPSPLVGLEKMGYSHPIFEMTSGASFFVEFFTGFFLVFVVLAIRKNETRRSSLVLAFAYVAIRLLSFPFTGGFTNPARSFGVTLIGGGGWDTLAVYLFGSPLGGMLAVFFFLYLHYDSYRVDYQFMEDSESL